MKSESRHPGEGAAARNVVSGSDDTSLFEHAAQELAPDPTGIAEWLQSFRPFIHVCAKRDNGRFVGKYFGDDVISATDYVCSANAIGEHTYVTVNIPNPDCGTKPSKADIVAIRFAHLDVDPSKDGSPFDKDAALAAGMADLPTMVVDSGNGLHFYIQFDTPLDATPENIALVEGLNKEWVARRGGDSAATDVSRILRIPHTVNWKADKGRSPCMAKVAVPYQADARPTVDAVARYFAPVAPPAAPQTPPASPVGSDAVIASLRRDPALWALWNGDLTGKHGDHSAAEMAVANAVMARCGWNIEQAKLVVMNAPLFQRAKVFSRPEYLHNTLAKTLDGQRPPAPPPEWSGVPSISEDEWQASKTTPPVIIENLIYQDVGLNVAAGGTGKTTVMEWMLAHVVLGVPFAGRKIVKPGRVVFVTAEDNRQILVARLREIFNAMFPHGTMPDDERRALQAKLRDGFRIIDVSAHVQRITCIDRDVVRVDHAAVDSLCELIAPLDPVIVCFDPAVSFGVGEARVNDAEQALVEAGRRIIGARQCAVFFVHHTGKQNSRDKTEDQYSGRGGSAFPDGSRMTFVMNSVEPKDWEKDTGSKLAPGETGVKMSIAKLSHTSKQKPIFIRRKGYHFECEVAVEQTDEQRNHANDAAVLAFIVAELNANVRHNLSSLDSEKKRIGLSRDDIRAAVHRLKEHGEIADEIIEGKSYSLVPTGSRDDDREGVAE